MKLSCQSNPSLLISCISAILWLSCLPLVAQKLSTADSLFYSAEYDLALSAYSELVKQSGSDAKTKIKWQCKAAHCYIRKSDLTSAESLINDNLKLLRSSEILVKELQAETFEAYGLIQMHKGRNDLAHEYLEKAEDIYNSEPEKYEAGLSSVYNHIGLVYWGTNNKESALEYFNKSLALKQNLKSANPVELAGIYNNIGLVYLEEEPEKAEEYFNQSLKINKAALSETHPSIAVSYNNLALVKRKQNKGSEAKKHLESVLEIWTKLYGQSHPNVAFTYVNLGSVYAEMNDDKPALYFYEKALGIYKSIYGEKHPDIANTYNQIGSLYRKKGKHKTVLQYYQKALIANSPGFENLQVSENPSVRSYYNADLMLVSLMLKAEGLEALYYGKSVKLKDLKLALKTLYSCDSLTDIIRRSRTKKSDKLQLGKTASEVYEDAIRICLALYDFTMKKSYLHQAFYFAEKSKSAILLDAISDTDAKHYANIPDHVIDSERKLKAEISMIEQKLASGSGTAEEITDQRNKLFQLNMDYRDFVEKLEKEYPEYYNLKYDVKQVTVPQLQQNLDKSTAIISYFLAENTGRIYIFRITHKHFDVLDTPKDPKTAKYIKGLRSSILFKEEHTFALTSSVLYEQLFPKSLPSGITSLLIIPDGALGSIPFEVLLTKKVKVQEGEYKNLPYLIQKASVSYAYSATLYYYTVAKFKQQENLYENDIFLCAPVNFEYGKNSLNSLPATEKEVQSINELFTRLGKSCRVCLKENAKENTIKHNDIRKYRYLHLATHGVVNESNPELSQIFLSPDPEKMEDGNLYAGEIYNLQLDAELVILSACQTGLGKIAKGEGIIGLTRALLYAGAKNLSVSLWTVNDQSTSSLMIDFYENLLKGQSRKEALRLAKLKMIKEGTPHAEGKLDVYYWSPFILIGN
ncbi:MAG: CHAT domain-containing protein [Cytophagaceae bacterium]